MHDGSLALSLGCSALTHERSIQVSPGDLVVTEKLRYVDVNQQIKISRVLMLGSRYESVIGRPLVPGAYVTAAIEVRQRFAPKGPVNHGMPVQELSEDMQRTMPNVEASMNDAGAISGCQGSHLQEAEEEEFQAAHGTPTGGTSSCPCALTVMAQCWSASPFKVACR